VAGIPASQFIAIVGTLLVIVVVFLPFLNYLNRLSAMNKVLLLQFPSQALNHPRAPSSVAQANNLNSKRW
jgi:hypothetical protein